MNEWEMLLRALEVERRRPVPPAKHGACRNGPTAQWAAEGAADELAATELYLDAAEEVA